MRNAEFLFVSCMGLLLLLVAPGMEAQVTTRQLPALYKTRSGLVHPVEITTEHTGPATSALVTVGRQTRKEKLQPGTNRFIFELPQVLTPATIEVSIDTGKDKKTALLQVGPIRNWQLNLVQHTHTDIGYTRSQTEILAEHLRYIDYALDFCDATDHYPEEARFRWTCEISWAVSEYLKCRPAVQIQRLRDRVNEGRIELAGMYLNFDELPDEQTLAASLYPLKQFREAGLKTELAMQNDVNGMGWCFTEYFADAGIRYVNMGTHGHRALICFDKPTVFWWESPSGKKVLTYRAEHYHYGNFLGIHTDDFEMFEKRTLEYLLQLEEKNYPYNIAVAQHSGYSTDNSPPSTNSSEFVQRWNEKYEWPKLRVAVATEFLKEVESNYANAIDTYRGAWPDWWTDGFGSGAREAAISRVTHSNIIAAQTASSFASMLGAELPVDLNHRIDEVNKALLFYDEHTFGFSESVRDPYGLETWEQRSLKQSYAWEAHRRSGLLEEVVMGALQTQVPRTASPAVLVFNTLNWSYSGVADVYIDHQLLPRNKAFEIVDHQGVAIAAQPNESRSDGTYWSLYVKDVPALGYAAYYIRVKDTPAVQAQEVTQLENPVADNQWYTIGFNRRKGTISRLFDKEVGEELLTPEADWEMGQFIYEIIDSRHPMERYTYPQFLRRPPEKMRFDKLERGAIWDSYRFRGETVAGREAGNLRVEYRVYHAEKKIEMIYRLRKKAIIDPEAVYISFPFEVKQGKVWLDVPGGAIEAGIDQIPGSSNDWYTVQNFAAARNQSYQVVMGSQEIPLMQFGAINTGRYEVGATPQTTHMYSWPMNNYWVTNFNADQMGDFKWSYFVGSSTDNSIGYANRFAWQNRIPLLTRVVPASAKGADTVKPTSIFTIENDNLLLVNACPVEGENAVLLQIRETGGKDALFKVRSDRVIFKEIIPCDVVGDPLPGNPAPQFRPWENKFIKLIW